MKKNCSNCKYWIEDDLTTIKMLRSLGCIKETDISGQCQKSNEFDYYKNYKAFDNPHRFYFVFYAQPSEEFVDYRKGASVYFEYSGKKYLSTLSYFNCNDYGHNNYKQI